MYDFQSEVAYRNSMALEAFNRNSAETALWLWIWKLGVWEIKFISFGWKDLSNTIGIGRNSALILSNSRMCCRTLAWNKSLTNIDTFLRILFSDISSECMDVLELLESEFVGFVCVRDCGICYCTNLLDLLALEFVGFVSVCNGGREEIDVHCTAV